jgi:penicillin amidase
MSEPERRSVTAPGLEAAAEIIVDRWGIPHIYAASRHDVFFVQGWNIARDRLWQLDLWRKRGLGRLSESFGPAYLAQDRATRLFLYRGDMDAEWATYGPDARAWSEAFVAGLNAYVGQVRAGAAPLPVEFELTNSTPEDWIVDDLVRIRSHGISNNAESESLRARVAALGGIEADRIRRKLDPRHTPRLPEGLDPADVPADLMAEYVLATQVVSFDAIRPADPPADAETRGSNNWAIGPSRTATGRPILASDPHRVMLAPSIRYVAHLNAPDLSLIGAGEPHLPGVTLGHNGRIAFAITIFMADQADFYVYELHPDDPRRYRYGDGWEAMRIVRETVAIKGEPPQAVELAFTRHGPVLKIDESAHRAFALRSVWFEPGTSPYFSAARYQTAGDWTEFRDALSHWGAAAMNFVYADTEGNIGWQAAGFLPRRPNWDGLTPVPGDGRYEWDGFLRQDELPSLYNPARGWVGTANEMNLPPAFEALNIGYEWADPSRMDRIAEVLSADGHHTLAASAALQTDVVSNTARRGIALLAGLTSSDPLLENALGLLRAWDGDEAVDSAAAAIAEVWLSKHLGPHTAQRITTPAAAQVIAFGSPYALIHYLQSPDAALGADPPAARDAVVLASLRTALDELTERLGPEPSTWRWGDLHHAHFVPPASALADADLKARMIHGPAPIPGSAYTVRAATYRPEDFALTTGASVRMVLDVGAWDASLVINTPGQSGDPASPHYADLFARWAQGDYVPLLWSREAVERAASLVIQLSP